MSRMNKCTYKYGIDVEAGGIVRVEKLVYDHFLEVVEKVGALHHVCLGVHLLDVGVVELALDDLEVLVVVDVLQDEVDDLV